MIIKSFKIFESKSEIDNFLLIFDNLTDSYPSLKIYMSVYDDKSEIHVELGQNHFESPPDAITVYIKNTNVNTRKNEFENIRDLKILAYHMDYEINPINSLKETKIIKRISDLSGYDLVSFDRSHGEIYLYFHRK